MTSVIARSPEGDEAIQDGALGPGLLRFARNDEERDGHMRRPAVYIMANRRNGTLYVGVTSNLPQRAWQHRMGLAPGFTSTYGCKTLVWYELHGTMLVAIAREKQIKGGSRKKKLALIEALNPIWRDLYEELI
jgi:predicted GIY-YIG superfamily endonuclease